MSEFTEHVRILVTALIFFMLVFVISYSKEWERLWHSSFVVIVVLFLVIAILAKWSQIGIGQTN